MRRNGRVLPFAACIVAAILASGCASSQHVSRDYTRSGMKGRHLRVMSIDSLRIVNLDDFRRSWPAADGDSTRILSDMYAKIVASTVDFAAVLPDTSGAILPDEFDHADLDFKGKDGSKRAEFRFPSAAALRKRGGEPDLALQVFNLEFRRPADSSRTKNNPNPITLLKGLEASGKYVIWDYRAGTPLAYGSVRVSAFFGVEMSKGTWQTCLERAALLQFRGTPFEGAKYHKLREKQYPVR